MEETVGEQDPIRLEQIGWIAALPCDGEPQQRLDGGPEGAGTVGKPVRSQAPLAHPTAFV